MSERRPEGIIARLRTRATLAPPVSTPWPIALAPAHLDPYLAATLWLVERGHGAVIAGPEAHANRSVHARAMLETVLTLDGSHPGPLAQRPGLGIVLAAPTCTQLERLNRRRFDPSAAWFFIPSELDTDARERQEAWLWAHSRPAPDAVATADAGRTPASALLSEAELWALSLRAGVAPVHPAPRRVSLMRSIAGGRA